MSWHHVKAISSGLGKFASSERRNTENNKIIKNFQCYDALKKRIFRILKNSVFHGTKTTLVVLLAFWRPEKWNFPNPKQIAFLLEPNQLSSNFLRFGALKNEYSESERNRKVSVL